MFDTNKNSFFGYKRTLSGVLNNESDSQSFVSFLSCATTAFAKRKIERAI
jgi:hypothetical protein